MIALLDGGLPKLDISWAIDDVYMNTFALFIPFMVVYWLKWSLTDCNLPTLTMIGLLFVSTAVSCTVRLRPQRLTTEGSNVQCTVTTSEWLCWYCELQMVVFPPTGCLIFAHIYCGFPLLSALMLNCRTKRMITSFNLVVSKRLVCGMSIDRNNHEKCLNFKWFVLIFLDPTRSLKIVAQDGKRTSLSHRHTLLVMGLGYKDPQVHIGARCLDMDSDLYICALTHILVHMHAWTQTHTHTYVQERKIIKNERRCRNGVPKSTQTRKDKSDGKYTKPHPSLHLFTKE